MTTRPPLETFSFRNTSGPPGLQEFTVDWATGLVRGQGEGFWSMEQTTAHFRRWVDCVRQLQAAGMRVRVLVDLRRSQAQSPEVAEFLRAATDGLYRTEDRLAMVMQNSLAKMQMRRVLTSASREYFLSPHAAGVWLASFSSRLDRAA